MKRHDSLVPLSREHHNGLVVAQGLIQGRSKAPTSTWPTARREQVDRVLTFFETELRHHFEAEEIHVFPAVSDGLRDGRSLVQRLRDDHDDMRRQIKDLAADPVSRLEERLRALGERLNAHIRLEEQVLFERMQAELSPEVLDRIGAALRTTMDGTDGPACRT